MSLKTPLAVLIVACIALPSVLSQTKTGEKPASPQDFSKEAYTIERYSTRMIAENDGTGTRETTAEVKMLADAGVKAFAVLNFTYTSANEVVEVDYVRVRKPDGTVVKTPDYNIQDMPGEVTRTAPLYSDTHEKHVAVKGLSVGDVLEYLVRFRVVKPEVPGHFWYEHSFLKGAIIKDERLEISVPREKYVKVVSSDFKPEVKDEGERRVYRWTHANLTVEEKDPNEVPRRAPPNPDVQLTTFANWEDVGRWYGRLQKDSLEVTPAIQAKATDLTKGLKTDDEKIRAIYKFVSLKFHYIGLDFGIGRYQPHAADDVLDNGYGDCKDKHTLLASLLKAAGYDAWPALIHSQRKLDPDVPSPAQFNHVITVVPSGAQFIWLDTTPEVAPYQLLMVLLRNKQALVVPSNKPALLMQTPENPPFPQEEEFNMKGKLGADGTFTGHVEQSYRGDAEMGLRMVFRQVSQSQWKEVMQGFSYRLNFGGDVSNVIVSPPEDLDKPIQLSYDYVRKNYSDWDNRQINLPLPPVGVEVTKDSKSKKPPEPVLLGAPGKLVYRARVELPPGYLAVAPSSMRLVESYAEYSTQNAIVDGVLTSSRQFVIKQPEVALTDWEGFRKFGRLIADDEFAYIRLRRTNSVGAKKNDADKDDADEDKSSDDQDIDSTFLEGEEALQRRDSTRAQEAFEKVIAKQPKYKGAHYDLAQALAGQNKLSEALTELHKEEENSPDDSRVYQTAAVLDNFSGRKDDAIGEWRKLLAVDPSNHDAALSLSRLLYQDGKYSEASEALEPAVKAAPDSPSLQLALGDAYLKSGQAEKAIPHLREAVKQGASDPTVLNDVAYSLAEGHTNLDLAKEYGEKALSALEEESQDSSAPDDMSMQVAYRLAMLWDTLGWVYFQRGEMTRAESFVRASWLLAQKGIVGEHLGEIYEKAGKNKAAAEVYAQALAAVGAMPPLVRAMTNSSGHPIAPSSAFEESDKQAAEITSRYQKLTGKKPTLNETVRLPNGEWTKTPGEQLSQMRTAKFGKQAKLSGSAQFTIVFLPGKIESVEYVSGDKSLKALTEKIRAAHYNVEFPEGSEARLLRRAQLSCFPSSGCMAVLMPVENPGARFGPPQ